MDSKSDERFIVAKHKYQARHIASSPRKTFSSTAVAAATSTVAIAVPSFAFAVPSADFANVDTSAMAMQTQIALEVAPSFPVQENSSWSFSGAPVKAGQKVTAPVSVKTAEEVEAEKRAAVERERQEAAMRGSRYSYGESSKYYGTGITQEVSGNRARLVTLARSLVGGRYVMGGANPSTGIDCSGMMKYIFGQIGISLPHGANMQRNMAQIVPIAQAQPGDILYWPGHVALYIGYGKFVGAQNERDGVVEGYIYGNPIVLRFLPAQ